MEDSAINHDIQKVFDYWVDQCRGNKKGRKPVLDTKRKRKIQLALRDYPLEDLLLAIDGVLKSPFHQGENQRHKKYDELTLILRDAEHIEQFIDYAEQEEVATAAEQYLAERADRERNG